MTKPFRNFLLALGALAMAAGSTAANAQFGSLFNDARRGAEQATSGCEEGKSGDAVSGAIGGMLGGIGRRSARSAGVPTFVPLTEFSDTLTTEIACKLDPEEQKQAANATLEATRGAEGDEGFTGPPVGQSASWTSGTRDDVKGSSTVTAREETGDDADCIMVTDVIIVEGEETRAEKRMCRPPGSARYSIVA
ncbi:MAG: hypothetical protein AAFQ13_05575 [Pseudomonadota bacterium]